MNRPSRRKPRSLVRRFVALVPESIWKLIIQYPVRIYFHPLILGKHSDDICENELTSFNQFSSNLSNSSTPKRKPDEKNIEALFDELQQLKQQIAKIMERNSPEVNIHEPEPPLMVPPPPPPLPPVSNTVFQQPLLRTPKKPKEVHIESQRTPFFLKDLDKVKLRQIDKSPGGGPLKQNKVFNDPADILHKLLRKRFVMVQDSTPERSSDGDWTHSFEIGGTPIAAGE